LEGEKRGLEKEIKKLDDQISRLSRNIIDYEKMKKNLNLFANAFESLSPEEIKRLLRLLVKKVTFYKDRIHISLRDLTASGLSLEKIPRFGNFQIWLPE